MDIEKSDLEWLITLTVMLLQNFPINITVKKQKPRKKRKPRKRKR